MQSNIVDLVNQDISISTNKGILMNVKNGIIQSFPVTGEPEWVAINVAGEIFFFEELHAPQIVKDLLGKHNH